MKEYKVDLSGYEWKVREVVSEAIQRHAFELGYEWVSGGKEVIYEKSLYLFFNKSSKITHLDVEDMLYFTEHSGDEIKAADFLALTPEDVQDALQGSEFRPFDRVLVRDSDGGVWIPHFYSHHAEYLTFCHRTIGDAGYQQCIPYEGNKHLLGTKEDVE